MLHPGCNVTLNALFYLVTVFNFTMTATIAIHNYTPANLYVLQVAYTCLSARQAFSKSLRKPLPDVACSFPQSVAAQVQTVALRAQAAARKVQAIAVWMQQLTLLAQAAGVQALLITMLLQAVHFQQTRLTAALKYITLLVQRIATKMQSLTKGMQPVKTQMQEINIRAAPIAFRPHAEAVCFLLLLPCTLTLISIIINQNNKTP